LFHVARDQVEVVYDLLEGYITFLPFDAQLDYLANFVRTGKIEAADNPHEPEKSFAFRTALEKTVPRLTRAQAEEVAKRLLLRFVQVQIDRNVARELTGSLPEIRKSHNVQATKRRPQGSFKLVIADHGEPVVAAELAEFITLFSDIYALAADLPKDAYNEARLGGVLADPEFYTARLHATLDNPVEIPPAKPLVIERMRKASPVTIWFGGIVTLIVIAAIISGGQLKIAGMSCKLNALGDGLKKLKAVFANQPELTKRAARKKNKALPPSH
jgi:hypothetical protein